LKIFSIVKQRIRAIILIAIIIFPQWFHCAILINKKNSPYYLTSDLEINKNDTLIISKGATVILSPGVNIHALGDIFINGTQEEPVLLIPEIEGKGWGRINVRGPNVKLKIEHAIIIDGTIYSVGALVEMNYVDFINRQNLPWNGAIARIIRGSANIQNCSITGIKKGEGFLNHNMDSVYIYNCFFEAIPDAVEFININNSLIRKNTFFNIADDAIDLNHAENILIDSNFIFGVDDRGFEIGSEHFGSSKDIILKNNLVAHCKEGICFKEGSNGIAANNTLYSNDIGVNCIENVSGFGGSKVIVENTIFSSSLINDIVHDSISLVQISSSISDKEILPGTNNLFGNPDFVNPLKYNYYLKEKSPCLNPKITNVSNTIRSKNHIGAYSDKNGIDPNPYINKFGIQSFVVYPNPFHDFYIVKYRLNKESKVKFSISSTSGEIISELINTNQPPSDYILLFSSVQLLKSNLKSAIYNIEINNDKKIIRIIKN